MKCKATNGTLNEVNWLFINNAYLPAISVCSQRLFTPEKAVSSVPNVEQFTIYVEDNQVVFNWLPDYHNYMYVDVKVNDGDWVFWVPEEWGGDAPGESAWSMPLSFYGAIAGDTIYARARFGNASHQEEVTVYSSNYATDSTTAPIFILLVGGEETPNLDVFINGVSSSDPVTFALDGNNVTVDNPQFITSIHIENSSVSGSLDVSQCSNLEELFCYNNPLSSVNAQGASSLTLLDCSSCPSLISATVLGCTSLNALYCNDTNLYSIDLDGLTGLNYVELYSCSNLNEVQALGVSGNGGKAYFSLWNCNFSEVALNNFFTDLGDAFESGKSYISIGDNPGSLLCDVGIAVDKGWTVDGGPMRIFVGTMEPSLSVFTSGATGDVTFIKHGNDIYLSDIEQLVTLDLHGANLHGDLYLSNNFSHGFTSLNISGVTGITNLSCYNNHDLTTLNITGCSGLITGVFESNDLSSLNCSGCTSLVSIHASYNPINSLNVADCLLEELQINNISMNGTLNLSGQTELVNLYASASYIKNINLTNCESLVILDISTNSITSLNLSYSPLVEIVNLRNDTSLNTLNITNCIHITAIDISYSQVATLDASIFAGTINSIYADSCLLASLDLSNSNVGFVTAADCANLTSIDITGCNNLANINATGSALTSLVIAGSPYNSLNQIRLNDNSLNDVSLNGIFTALPTHSGYIEAQSNPGSLTCDSNIALIKGWTVLV